MGAVAVAGVELKPEEKALVAKIALKVVRAGLTVPAILALEVHRPLSFVASQALHMLAPFVSMFLDASDVTVLARMLERRESIEEIIVAIEEADAVAQDAKSSGKSSTREQP